MAHRKRRRSATEVERDKLKIANMYLRGIYQAEIAEQIGLSQSTVSRHLHEMQAQWMASSLVDINERKAQEVAKIDQLEREYYEAWTRSQLDAEVKTTRARGKRIKDNKPIPEEVEQTERREGRTGNPAFLAGVQWCIEQRCKIFGLYAPEKLQWQSEAEAAGIDPAGLFNDLVAKYVTALQASDQPTE